MCGGRRSGILVPSVSVHGGGGEAGSMKRGTGEVLEGREG
jgi:hypothetical protein